MWSFMSSECWQVLRNILNLTQIKQEVWLDHWVGIFALGFWLSCFPVLTCSHSCLNSATLASDHLHVSRKSFLLPSISL